MEDLATVSLQDDDWGAKLSRELSDVGFLYLSDARVDTSELFRLADEFFSLPEEKKRRIGTSSGNFRGFSALGSEVTLSKRDWHECIDFLPARQAEPLAGENQYPSSEFEAAVEAYYGAMNDLGRKIMSHLNVPLDLDEPFSLLRILHYPVMPDEETRRKENIDVGIGCHTDYGFLTLIVSDAPGLQVDHHGSWINTKADTETFVVNIGDSLAALSGLKATPHRVVHSGRRISIAFFFEPSFEQRIEPLDGSPSYRYGDYLAQKYAQSYPETGEGAKDALEQSEDVGGNDLLARVPLDVFGLVFTYLGPLEIITVSAVCQRLRAAAQRCKVDTASWVKWLKRELNDHYLPYNRLSYYDRNYKTGELSMTWPKRPLTLHCHLAGDASLTSVKWDVKTHLDDIFGGHIGNQGPNSSHHTVEWEGHQVHCRCETPVFTTNHANFAPRKPTTHDVHLIFALSPEQKDFFGKMVPKQAVPRTADNYVPAFGPSENFLHGGDAIVVQALGQLSIDQIFHCIRGDLPPNFPTLEQIEAFLPRHLVEESRANWKQIESGDVNVHFEARSARQENEDEPVEEDEHKRVFFKKLFGKKK